MFEKRSAGDTEILLGNKQLLGIFVVAAILFGLFFTAGYFTGRGFGPRRPQLAATSDGAAPGQQEAKHGQTGAAPTGDTAAEPAAGQSRTLSPDEESGAATPATHAKRQGGPSAFREGNQHARPGSAGAEPAANSAKHAESEPSDPNPGTTYLQVAALARPEAEAVAEVLSKRGFRAHIAPKPGDKYFRVLVGPLRDAGDLSATRDALVKTGFREVLVRRY